MAVGRLFVFAGAGDPIDGDSGVRALCNFLAESTNSPVRKHTRAGDDIDTVFDVRAVFQRHHDLGVEAMPALLLPRKGLYGLVDYEKVFCADTKNGDIFELRGIDRIQGLIVVVRPDQYVANVLPLDAHGALNAFFAGFVLPN